MPTPPSAILCTACDETYALDGTDSLTPAGRCLPAGTAARIYVLDGELLHFGGLPKPRLPGHDQGGAADRFFGEVRRAAWGARRAHRPRLRRKW